ncbi:MAG: hypothetical protein Q7S29_02780 [Candidatus Peribacter sp.]|nr:hypothetical protein [Candidatus Peribacter sp.]
MNTPAATPTENTEILPAGFKIDRDQLKTDVSIAYEETSEGISARFSTVNKNQNRRTLAEKGALMAAAGMTTGKTRAEARQKVINALAAAMIS